MKNSIAALFIAVMAVVAIVVVAGLGRGEFASSDRASTVHVDSEDAPREVVDQSASDTLAPVPAPVLEERPSPSALLAVSVEGVDGRAVAGVEISAVSTDGNVIEAATNGEGHATLTLRDGTGYRVSGRSTESVISTVDSRAGLWVVAGLRESVELIAHRCGTVVVEVNSPVPLQGRRVTIETALGQIKSRQPWSPEERTVRLRPGTHRVRAFTDDRELTSVEFDMTVSLGSEHEIELELAPACRLVGTMVLPEDERSCRAEVRWRLHDSNPESARRLFVPSGDGSFAAPEALEAGTYVVSASRDFNGGADVEVVVELPNPEPIRLELPPLSRDEVLVAWVFDSDGQLLADVGFHSWEASAGPLGVASSRMRDGSHWLLLSSDRRAVTTSLTAGSKQFGERDLPMTSGDALEFRFDAKCRIEISIIGAPDLSLSARLSPSDSRSGQPAIAVQDGLVVFESYPGPHRLDLFASTPGGQHLVSKQDLKVTIGDQRVPVNLPRLATVVVTSTQFRENESVMLYSNERETMIPATTEPGSDGQRIVFTAVPLGDWMLIRSAPGARSVQQTVTVAGDVELELHSPIALSGAH